MADNLKSVIQETPLNGEIDNTPPMKRKKPVALVLVLLCIIIVIAIGAFSKRIEHDVRVYGELKWGGVQMTVDQELEGAFLVKVVNNNSEQINFGWVDFATAILNTNKGSYICKLRREIPGRTSASLLLVFPQANGIPERISFESVGTGLGANSTIEMNLSMNGEGTIQPMNIFEIAWAYIRWFFYWFISASSMVGNILRVFIAVGIIYALIHLFSLLIPRNSIRAKLVRKFIEETTEYQNGLSTGTTYTYYAVFQTEKGKQKKVNVRSRNNYNQLNLSGWGLLTMKGILFVRFDYLPSVGRTESASQKNIAEKSASSIPIKKHRVLPWILGIISLVLIVGFVYLYLNPNSMQSLIELMNKTFVQ